ncbi:DNA topoisomerase [Mycoplasmopsis caviae]|uniref:DNA topoisomerase n=1 Tax=Mycoplasmopsis caviae TaxID=55603 RepID=A0A3P8LIJ9_9BACT|nr:DNA topoisomerase [Mycoplasmopsis caviae]UUD34833.1 DNA topoisomerase [Mycoplasmopsis caviae]VDR42312.1 DNA topoisomerase 1 [Mycoplasmopsis caviae]
MPLSQAMKDMIGYYKEKEKSMKKSLILIEGSGKVKTTKSLLGNNYDVKATMGHFTNLADDGVDGIGFDENFNPIFVYSEDGKKHWHNAIKDIDNYENIYIASDPDREGEAIGWHIYQHLPRSVKNRAKRISYNEITKSAITNAINNPRDIDTNLVYAQFVRQLYDKDFGYKSSRVASKISNATSIGRVQSVVVKMLNDRDNEIKNSVPIYKNIIKSSVVDNERNELALSHINNLNDKEKVYFELYDKSKIAIYNNEFKDDYRRVKCLAINNLAQRTIKPDKPYITSKLLMDANKKFKFSPSKTTSILQYLYEQGYITYPRTDSMTINDNFKNELKDYTISNFGLGKTRNELVKYQNKESAQAGHECLRIAHLERNLNSNEYLMLNDEQKKIYKLIWDRTLIQFLNDAIKQDTEYLFINELSGYYYLGKTSRYVNKGFKEYLEKCGDINSSEESLLTFNFEVNKTYNLSKLGIEEYLTNPQPALYKESDILDILEKKEIGRPSTYSSYSKIVLDRKYATLNSKNQLELSQSGKELSKLIDLHFSNYINYDFTKNFEKQLDLVATNKTNWKELFKKLNFDIDRLVNSLKEKYSDKFKKEETLSPNHYCSKCNEARMIKVTSNGKTYVKCKNSIFDPKTKSWSGCNIEWIN